MQSLCSRCVLRAAGTAVGLSLALALPLGAQEPPQEVLVEEKLLAADGVDRDNFGAALAIEGDTLVVAAPWADADGTDAVDSSGVVYVFLRDQTTGQWNQHQKLVPEQGHYDGNFLDMTLAIQGDTLVVGAPYATLDRFQEGAVHVFERDETGHWAPAAKITDRNAGFAGHFGASLALAGDLLVVGATQDSIDGHGRVGIFERDRGGPGNWGKVTTLYGFNWAAPESSPNDAGNPRAFGSSVAVQSDLLLIGATSTTVAPGNADGALYLFRRDATDSDRWTYLTRLVRPGADDCVDNLPVSQFYLEATPEEIEAAAACAEESPFRASSFGDRVAIQGDTVVVSARSAAGEDGSYSVGEVHVYERDPSGVEAWLHVATLAAPEALSSAYFGSDLLLAGDTLLVAAHGTTIDSMQYRGAVHVFERDAVSHSWTEIEKLVASDGLSFGFFGQALAFASHTRLIGAMGHQGGRGAVYLHEPAPPDVEPQACQPSFGPTAELGDGDVVEATSGVLLGTVPGTLSGSVPVWIHEVAAPAEPLFENALPVGAYYNVGAECTTFAPHGSPFGIALPVPDGVDTTRLAAAALVPASYVSDGPLSGELWEALPGDHDADHRLFTVSLYGLPSEGTTLVLIEHPDLGPLDLPAADALRAGAHATDSPLWFRVTCMNGAAANPGCDQAKVQEEMLEAASTYREQGFPEPYIEEFHMRYFLGMDEDGEWVRQPWIYGVPYKRVWIWPSSELRCHPGGSRYHHLTEALAICLPPGGSSPTDEWWEYVVPHQLFHAIQFSYPNVRGSLGAVIASGWTDAEPPWDQWVLEGTADAAVESNAVMRRTPGADPLLRPLRRADVTLTDDRTETHGYPYETQDFWVHLLASDERNLNLGELASFLERGASTEAVADRLINPPNLTFENLGREYWAWVTNQIVEKDLTFDDALQNPCTIEADLISVANSFVYPESDQVFDALKPLQSELIRIDFLDFENPEGGFDNVRILAEGDQLKYKVYLVEDYDTDPWVVEPNCREIPDGDDDGRSFADLPAGSVVYVLLSRTRHAEEVVEPPLYRVWIERETLPEQRESKLNGQ
jgi:FG-GAP repeat